MSNKVKPVLIGCPVYKRDWVLPDWFAAIEKQNYPLEKIGFIFELGNDDEATEDVLYEWHQNHPQVRVFDGIIRENVGHRAHPDGKRHWNGTDYLKMVLLRNELLERASCMDYEYYFSLDSDVILEDPDTIPFLVSQMSRCDVISPLMYMTPFDDSYPSVMWWDDHVGYEAHRNPMKMKYDQVFQTDIVMAAKMMRKEVFQNVRYSWHRQGEDLGFAANLKRAGFKAYCAPQIYAFHAMHRQMLADYKERGFDPRNPRLRNHVLNTV